MPDHALPALAMAFTLLLAAAAGGARAETDPPTLADRLSTMDAQLQLLRKQMELDQALSVSAVTTIGTLPRVVAIYGWEPALQARLLLAGGMVATFQEGDVIRGAMRVVAISPQAVIVSVRNGRRNTAVPLEFVAAVQPAGAVMPMPPGMPGTAAPQGPLPPELLPLPPSLGVPLPPAATGQQRGARVGQPPIATGRPAAPERQP